MKPIKLLLKPETLAPMLALIFASTVSVALVIGRIAWTRNIHYGFLAWNLLLAWLPLLFAVLARDRYANGAKRDWRFYVLAGAWLLFFPNAPYIFTDVIHLNGWFWQHYWIDLAVILLCALTGLVLGFVSLYLMQSVVARMYGRRVSWFFIAAVAGLSSFGIYLGRFQRFNSWDVIVKPMKLYRGIGAWVENPLAHATTFAFPILFAVFLFIAYVMLYALTHLPQAHQMDLVAGTEPEPSVPM